MSLLRDGKRDALWVRPARHKP